MMSNTTKASKYDDIENILIPHVFEGNSRIGFPFYGSLTSEEESKAFKLLIEQSESYCKSRLETEILDRYLILRGYVHKNGTKNYRSFCTKWDMKPSVLTKGFLSYTAYQKSIKSVTLFKIIIALRMSLDDAVLLLFRCGCGFYTANKLDVAVYHYIKSEYLGSTSGLAAMQQAKDFIDTYSNFEVSKSKNNIPIDSSWLDLKY